MVRVVEGPLFSEVVSLYQHFQQTIRIHNVPGVDGLSLDVTTMVDIREQSNKELAMRLVTDIQNDDTFYTDLNGFQVRPQHTLYTIECLIFGFNMYLNTVMFPQMQPRRRLLKLPLQANFYPMPSQAYIQDSQHRLTLHSAQALGATSLESGREGPLICCFFLKGKSAVAPSIFGFMK